MSFTVQLTISGLCMFVPSRGKDGPLHVLMPPSHRHGGAHDGHHRSPGDEDGGRPAMEKHTAALVWDRAHESEDSAATSDYREHRVLDGYVVRIARGVPDALDPSVATEKVVMLDQEVYFEGVDDRTLSDPARVAARAELYAGRVARYQTTGRSCLDDPGVCGRGDCTGKKRCQPMAENVCWVVRMEGDWLELRQFIELVTPGGGTTLPVTLPERLHPIDGVVMLRLMHVVDRALPVDGRYPDNPAPTAAGHFTSYYDLAMEGSTTTRLVPVPEQVRLAAADDAFELLMPSVICATSQARFE